MLLQFSVENYKSIKQKAVLSLEASSDQLHGDKSAHLALLPFLLVPVFFDLQGCNIYYFWRR